MIYSLIWILYAGVGFVFLAAGWHIVKRKGRRLLAILCFLWGLGFTATNIYIGISMATMT